MRSTNLLTLTLATLVGGGLTLATGCAETDRYETNKPVIEAEDNDLERTGDDIEASAKEAWEDTKEGARDAVDAVVPDEPIVDVESPLGDVKVGEDPVTGDKNVEVDAGPDADEE